ncbi:MAG TPA: class II aldolase family protein [Anaerolineaceae bacterium]|nr:class II aldolase family protein [Anaerolineaceae bacterium]
MSYPIYKQAIYETTLNLVKVGLIRLSSGNISTRLPDGNIAITPSGILYDKMKPDDIVIMDLGGNKIEGKYKPSSEKALHNEIYKAHPDVNAVVHTHSIHAIAFSTVGIELPVVCLELVFVGGPIPVADYQTPGTVKVGIGAAKHFSEKPGLRGLLLQNHGLVAIGNDLNDAYQNAYNLETGAEIYHLALQTGKKPISLTDFQITQIFEQYKKPGKY